MLAFLMCCAHEPVGFYLLTQLPMRMSKLSFCNRIYHSIRCLSNYFFFCTFLIIFAEL